MDEKLDFEVGDNNRYKYWENEYQSRQNELCDTSTDFSDIICITNKQSCDTELTHTDHDGKAKMVDVGQKPSSGRVALACATIYLGEVAFGLVRDNKMKKGDVLTVAQLAGIMAAKDTSRLIPLCHNISLSKVSVDLTLDARNHSIYIVCEAKTHGQTGVEMEAITGATVAAVTFYDMCKAVNKKMVIGDIKLLKKSGGTRGDYVRD